MAKEERTLTVGEKLVPSFGMMVILYHLLNAKGTMGARETAILENGGGLSEDQIFNNLRILEENGFASARLLQTVTGGGASTRFWQLAPGVCVKCTVSKDPQP